MENKEYALVKGKTYTFKLRWVATDPDYEGFPSPDFDWRCLINDSTAAGAREGLYGTGAFVVEDPGHLLTDYTDGGNNNLTIDKEGKIHVPKVVLDVNADGDADDAVDGAAGFLPGREGATAKIEWGADGGYVGPQGMKLALAGMPDSSRVDAVTFEILETTAIPGFCSNSASGGTGDDFSLSASADARGPVQGGSSGGVWSVPFYCKDFGGWCRVRAVCRKNGAEVFSLTADIPEDANGNRISDAWEKAEIARHNAVYPANQISWDSDPYADTDGDNEPAALGNRRTDGSYSHADTGDGLTVMDEYRGYLLDGGADFAGTRHKRLSPALKELLVQANEQENMAGDVGTGPAANPTAFAAFNKTLVMQSVAQFYSNPTRGAGIDLYWVSRPFVPVVGSAIDYETNGVGRADAYRYTGQMFYYQPTTPVCSNELSGSTQIITDGLYRKIFGVPAHNVLFPPQEGILKLEIEQNRDNNLSGFTMLLFKSRSATILNNGVVRPIDPPACRTYASDDIPVTQQGVVILSVMVSEENPFNYAQPHYLSGQFTSYLMWATAHEIGHLIAGEEHSQGSGGLMGSRTPIDDTTISGEECLRIDLKSRKGVTQ
jgi:hypothetical protein